MRIEKEIPKNYFRNEHHKALVNIIFTANFILEKLKQFLETEGITHQQYNILRILINSEGPLSTLKIREQMLDKMSDTSRIVERLLKKELVHKKLCPTDKRLVDVTISEKGRQLIEKLNVRNNDFDSFMMRIPMEEIDTLNYLLDKVREKD